MGSIEEGSSGDGALYLVKLPQRLGTTWSSATVGAELGDLILENGALRLETQAKGASVATIFDVARMDATATNVRLFRKRPAPSGGADAFANGAVLGSASAAYGLTPRQDIGYRRVCRTRMFESMQSTRVVQPLAESEVPQLAEKAPVAIFKRTTKADAKMGGGPGKPQLAKGQMEKGALKSKLFAVLSAPRGPEDPPIVLKEVQLALGDTPQQDSHLKAVLLEICDTTREKGKVVYALKAAYRDNTRPPEALPATAET